MRKQFLSMGLVLLVTVLLVTLLADFSLLSLSAAREDMARAQALARSSSAYYAACNEAEEIRAALIRGAEPDCSLLRLEGTVTYQIPMDEGRSLRVTLQEGTWEVLAWQTLVPWEP